MDRTAPNPDSLGPTLNSDGIHFSIYSEHATAVDLCLFDSPQAVKESQRIPLTQDSDFVWRVHVPNLKTGCLYGYRMQGPYRPAEGHRFNPSKLLLDPYAKALGRTLQWHGASRSVPPGTEDGDGSPPNTEDSAPYAPLGKVIDTSFDWGDDRPPETPWEETVIYETHVKGMTQQHPGISEELRGTYTGLASQPVVEHLTGLGITAIELLPVHQISDEFHLHANGLTNYWGYNPLLFFAPDIRLARRGSSDPAGEFKEMVRTFHKAGIEVILDMVFNHTAESDLHGPTLSFRGIDNAVYYRTEPDHPARYADFTGCGNTFNLDHPRVRQLVLDCLRYWVKEMHIDGFRLDLAVTLGRERVSFDPEGGFFKAIAEDPALSRVKWIAEPWDLGPDGYQLSNFPNGWSEWNDQYRQTVRKFWRGDAGQTQQLARRIAGSHDLFAANDRPPHATVNYITSHDGFTLEDMVSYEHKHNEANGENNQDGSNGNDSCNYGVEGPTDDPALNGLRLQQKRNLLATLLLSVGTPMISGGDEIGRTQQGNNNAYCQDNPITWYNWSINEEQKNFLEFTRSLIQLRKSHLFNQAGMEWLLADGTAVDPLGQEFTETECLGCVIESANGESPALLIAWNRGEHSREFILPGASLPWQVLMCTADPDVGNVSSHAKSLKTHKVPGHSLMVFTSATHSLPPQNQD